MQKKKQKSEHSKNFKLHLLFFINYNSFCNVFEKCFPSQRNLRKKMMN